MTAFRVAVAFGCGWTVGRALIDFENGAVRPGTVLLLAVTVTLVNLSSRLGDDR